MPATIQREPDGVYVLRISGTLLLSEFSAVQNATADAAAAGGKPRVLAILDRFEGWGPGAQWGDLDFMFSHLNQIAKIAIVGDPQWEAEVLAFAGAGFRKAPVKFFPAEQQAQARAWLLE
jgi:hypothetical protein